jgi:hypothetical protein
MFKSAKEKIVDVVVAQDLYRHPFFEAAIGTSGFKNHPHPSASKLLLKTISPKLRACRDGYAEKGIGSRVIHQASARLVTREHPEKLIGQYGIGLREIGQERVAPRRRFRKKGLELCPELAEFFSRHT